MSHSFDTLIAALPEGRCAVSHMRGKPVAVSLPVAFRVDGRRYSLAQMLADNGDDPEFTAWACTAKPGDVFPEGEGCECIADAPRDYRLIRLDAATQAHCDRAVGLERNDDRYPMVGGA